MDQKMSDELNRVTNEYLGGTPQSRLQDVLDSIDLGFQAVYYGIKREICRD